MKNKITRGERFHVTLNYVLAALARAADHASKRPELIGSNMAGGADPRALAAEFAAVRRLRPDVKKPVWHCSLALPNGERLDSKKWADIAQRFLEKMGFDVALTPYICVRHSDKPKSDHVHVVLSRISLSGGLWHGQWEARRAIVATQQLEREFGLVLTPGLHGDDDAAAKAKRPERQADSQAVINANRSKTQRKVDTKEIARVLLACAARSRDLPSFTTAAAVAGIQVLPNRHEKSGVLFGLSVKLPGRKFPLALSDATKNRLTWGKLLKAWEQNDQIADAARRAAADVVAAATARSTAQVEARIGRQRKPAPEIPQARAMLPEDIATTKESIVHDHDETDPLSFLSVPPPKPRPHGQQLDDAGLAPAAVASDGAVGEPPAQADEEAQREQLERDEAELDSLLRKMTPDELFDCRNVDVPPVVLSLANLVAVLALVARILSLGLVKVSNPFAAHVSAKKALSERAELELLRRKRSPASAGERMKVLDEHEKALRTRVLKLGARASLRSNAALHGHSGSGLRAEVEASFDRVQVSEQKPPLRALNSALVAAMAVEQQARAAVEGDERVGVFGLRVPRGTAAKLAAARRVQALATARKERAAAQRARNLAVAIVDALMEKKVAAAQVQVAEQRARVRAEEQQREGLLIELGESPTGAPLVPPTGLRVERQRLELEALRERARGVAQPVGQVEGQTDAEREAWLKSMRKGG